MVVDQQMSNDAEDIAKNLIGAIVNEVMRLIMEQSGKNVSKLKMNYEYHLLLCVMR